MSETGFTISAAAENSAVPAVAWFCLRSQPKHEHIAASHLRKMEGIEIFHPRIRFKRSTRLGPALVTEALFPNYLFARFDWKSSLVRVHYAPGIAGVVHFGSKWPTIPDQVIEDIRQGIGPDEVQVVPAELAPGDVVRVSGGAFHGLDAVVKQVMPGRQRVMVLMDFLGRQSTVVVEASTIIRHGINR